MTCHGAVRHCATQAWGSTRRFLSQWYATHSNRCHDGSRGSIRDICTLTAARRHISRCTDPSQSELHLHGPLQQSCRLRAAGDRRCPQTRRAASAAPHGPLCARGAVAFLCSAAATCTAEDAEAVKLVLRAAVATRTVHGRCECTQRAGSGQGECARRF